MSLQKRTWLLCHDGVSSSHHALYVEHKLAQCCKEEFVALYDIDSIGASCKIR
jgi:hypothetical protein